jgi:predicted 3-demethylubiquinone-9 3-methyltransferase (glyoxalase superfamily)
VKKGPDKEEVENFWREIYGKKIQHNEEVCWIKDQYQQNPGMEWSPYVKKTLQKH